jgi:hypothetical protein
MTQLCVVSSEMFETMNKRARAIAEEQYRRVMWGCTPDPQIETVREEIIDSLAEELMQSWVNAAAAPATE